MTLLVVVVSALYCVAASLSPWWMVRMFSVCFQSLIFLARFLCPDAIVLKASAIPRNRGLSFGLGCCYAPAVAAMPRLLLIGRVSSGMPNLAHVTT